MSNKSQQLGSVLWSIASKEMRGKMNTEQFREYLLPFIFFYHLSDRYEKMVKDELGSEYPVLEADDKRSPLAVWYENNPESIEDFENVMQSNANYKLKPEFLWQSIATLAQAQSDKLLETLQKAFKYIEEESFTDVLKGLFTEVTLNSEKLGREYIDRNNYLCKVLTAIDQKIHQIKFDGDVLGDAYEYLIAQFASQAGKKAGEYYTPQAVSTVLSRIVTLDCQDPTKQKTKLNKVLDFACGSGSLLLNISNYLKGKVGKIYGQELNLTTYNLARMNMLLHGMKPASFEIFLGDTLKNDWNDIFYEDSPTKFDAIVANPPFSQPWDSDKAKDDFRFSGYGSAPKKYADFAFLLHGLHFLKDDGTMAIILPHGVLFRGDTESVIRKALLKKGYIDTIISLPANLFYSTGIPVCILVIKKCTNKDGVYFINAEDEFTSIKNQDILEQKHIDKIIDHYQHRKETEHYSRFVPMQEIEENDYNLSIARYVNKSQNEDSISIEANHQDLENVNQEIKQAIQAHNKFLKELGLPELS